MNPNDFDLENGTLIGCGAIAFVNRCKHIKTQNHFAVKTVSKIQALQQNKTDGLKAEKSVLTRFSYHPGVVHLFGTTQSLDEIYFIMENLTRGDLMEHIKRISGLRRQQGENGGVCLRRKDAQKIVIQVLLTLKALWDGNVVHRDVKPENIAFHSTGRAVLIDFDTVLLDAPSLKGNGTPLLASSSTTTTTDQQNDENDSSSSSSPKKKSIKISEIQSIRKKSQAFCGTAQFVSPETLTNCDWTFSSDLFGLGATLYFMLAGRPIFDGPNTFSVLSKIRNGVEKIPLNEWSEGARNCKGAMNLIRKLLSSDPRDRFCKFNETKECFELDLESFKKHDFFDDANELWEKFEKEEQIALEELKYQVTAVPSEERLSKTSSLTPCQRILTKTTTQKTTANHTPSTSVSYIDEPKHDDEYSQYALKSTASDLERWWRDAIEGVASATNDDEKEEGEDIENKETEISNGNKQETHEDDDVEVIDDVGQQQFVTSGAFNEEADKEKENENDDE